MIQTQLEFSNLNEDLILKSICGLNTFKKIYVTNVIEIINI